MNNKKLNPDNATSNAKVKQTPNKNRKAGAGQRAYQGVRVTSVPASVAKDRLKEVAPVAIPAAGIGAIALASLLKQQQLKK